MFLWVVFTHHDIFAVPTTKGKKIIPIYIPSHDIPSVPAICITLSNFIFYNIILFQLLNGITFTIFSIYIHYVINVKYIPIYECVCTYVT